MLTIVAGAAAQAFALAAEAEGTHMERELPVSHNVFGLAAMGGFLLLLAATYAFRSVARTR